jgi:hypothetical protein
MTDSLDINGRELQSIKHAAKQTGYSHDYVTKLAREGKIVAAQIGRNWFVDIDSLQHYSSVAQTEQLIRQRHLSEERKNERASRVAAEKRTEEQERYRRRFTRMSKAVACAVLLLGLVTGFALQRNPVISSEINRQMASVPLIQRIFEGDSPAAQIDVATEVDAAASGKLNFSHEAFRLATLAESTEGILIFPNATNTRPLNPAELFSDVVRIVTDKNGVEYVARVNEKGEVVEKVPYVAVPVHNDETP